MATSLLVKRPVDKFLDLCFGFRCDDGVQSLAVLIEDQGGDDLDLLLIGKQRLFINVYLSDGKLSTQLLLKLFQSRRDPAAVDAPGSPKLYQNRLFRRDKLVKKVLVHGDHKDPLLSVCFLYYTQFTDNFCDIITKAYHLAEQRETVRQIAAPRRSGFLGLGELVLAYAAKRTLEIRRNILPLGAGSDSGIGTALCLIIFPTANVTNIFHNDYLHVYYVLF